MTKEDLMKITDPNVGIKVLDIMFNSFEALFNKEIKSEDFEITLEKQWFSSDGSFSFSSLYDKGFQLPGYFAEIHLKLTDWAIGLLLLGFDIKENISVLRKICEIKNLKGQMKVNEFKKRCDDENLSYKIVYMKEMLFTQLTKKISEMGKGVFKITKSNCYSRKFIISLTFDCDSAKKKSPVTMKVFFCNHEDFLESLQNFIDKCRVEKIDTIKEIETELDELPLRDFRLVTKKVLNRIIRKDKSHKSLQQNLGLGKFGTNFVKNLFASNSSLEYVSLPEGMKEIPDSLFMFCENLRSVEIPESVEEIGYKAFYGCKNLKYVNLPKHLNVICSKAFAYCDSLKKVCIPNECFVSKDAFLTDWDAYD